MLPKENRLTKKSDFENVRESGRFFPSKNFSISFVKRKEGRDSRFGIIVSKKISKLAVDRNRARRIIKEIIRKNIESVKPGYDNVILAKSGILRQNSAKIETELKEAWKKIGL